jgi:hypothetical protein
VAIRVLCIAAVLLALGIEVSAQTASVNNNLVFGDVFPGIPKKIDKKTAGGAAEFIITGTAGDDVTIDFALPTYMNDGGFNVQLIFDETSCALDSSATPDQSNPGLDNLDPWHTINYTLGLNGITVWLGGTVVPRLNQMAGNYSAQIVLTVAYSAK